MLDSENLLGDDSPESAMPPPGGGDSYGRNAANQEARRRIERMRELKRLRELLDEPDFDDLT